jgi:hypothetical protein
MVWGGGRHRSAKEPTDEGQKSPPKKRDEA